MTDPATFCAASGCRAAVVNAEQRLCAVHWLSSGHAEVLELELNGENSPDEAGTYVTVSNATATNEAFSEWLRVLAKVGHRDLELESPRTVDGRPLDIHIGAGAQLEISDPPDKVVVRGPKEAPIRGADDVRLTVVRASDLQLIVECRASVRVIGYTSLTLFWSGDDASALVTCRPSGGRGPSALHLIDDHGPLELNAQSASANEIRLRGGRWSALDFGPWPIDLLELRDLKTPRVAVIDQDISVLDFRDTDIDDLELTHVKAEHVWLRGCNIGDLHETELAARTHWVDNCTIGERCSIRSSSGQSLALTNSTFSGRVTVIAGDPVPQLISLAGSRFGSNAHLVVSGRAPLQRVSLDLVEADASLTVGSPQAPATVSGRELRTSSSVSLHVRDSGELTTKLEEVIATDPVTITVYPNASDGASEVTLTDAQVDAALRIEGANDASCGRPFFHGTVESSELRIARLDLAQTSFTAIPLDRLRLGPDNSFEKRQGRRQIFDARPPTGTFVPDHRVVANQYRGLRVSLEAGSSVGLANDFYIGEMVARRAAPNASLTERGIIWVYGLVGGWGVRPGRPAAWLMALLVALCLVGAKWGLDPKPASNPSANASVVAAPLSQAEELRPSTLEAVSLTLKRLLPWGTQDPAAQWKPTHAFDLGLLASRVLVVLLVGFIALGLRSHVRR